MIEPLKKDTRTIAMGLAAAAALCLIYASFTRHWLINSSQYEDLGFGLRGNYQCAHFSEAGDEQCQSMSNGELVDKIRQAGGSDQASGAFAPMGWVTLICCLAGALGLLGALGLAAAKKTPDLPMAPTTLALLGLMIGLITGCVFIATKPGPPGFVGVGMSFWAFGVGCVMGIFAAQQLAKVNRPPDPDLLEGAMNPDQI